MSFLDDVDALEQRIQAKSVSPLVLIGIVAVALVIVFFIAQAVLGSLISDEFSINQNNASQGSISQDEYGEVAGETGTSEGVSGSDLVVYVTGEVLNPGVYTLVSGSRINDAIESAGGVTSKGVLDGLNLAELLSDGMQITVLSKSEAKSMAQQSGAEGSSPSNQNASAAISGGTGKVNINTASAAELQTLKGIGPALSERIVEYREANGRFSKVQDLKNVSGIGDKTYESLVSSICV